VCLVKAFKHLLVLPRRLIPGYGNLTADDVPLLKEMQKRGQMTVEQYGTPDRTVTHHPSLALFDHLPRPV
jgi:hypothetical protein